MKRMMILGFLVATTLFASARYVPADKNSTLVFNGKTIHSGDAIQKEELFNILNAHLETTSHFCAKTGQRLPFRCMVSLMDSWGTLKFNSTLPNTNNDKFKEALGRMNSGDKVYLNEITFCDDNLHVPAHFVFTLL